MTEKNIHTAILEVMNKVGYVQKGGRVTGGGANYSYAGEADLIAALRPAMLEAGIYMHVVSVTDIQRESFINAKGTHMMNTAVNLAIRFTHAPSGTYIDVGAAGEGTDSGDKSTPKSLTGAYKYALRQTFCIETGDDPDQQPSDEQVRAAPPPAFEIPEWTRKAQAICKEKKIRFRDIPDLKIRPETDAQGVIAHLKIWANNLKPKPKNDDELLAEFEKITVGVVGLTDAA